MLILLSPAKTQEFERYYLQYDATQPEAIQEITALMTVLKSLNKADIVTLMKVSDKIAALNYQRFQQFDLVSYTRQNAKQALFAFQGDAYQALAADSLTPQQVAFLQNHLIILSGLYGYLKPLDLIQPYRLEMKTLLSNARGKDLYAFWGNRISLALEQKLQHHHNKTIINLASHEYAKAVTQAMPHHPIISITFKEKKGNALSVAGIHAKRARGMMVRYIALTALKDPEQLTAFNEAGYQFDGNNSSKKEYVFIRQIC